MNYHNLTYPDQNNGDGLRVVLWLSGCSHHCKGCQNPQTWDEFSGIEFDNKAKQELFETLNHDYITGITLTGGDPLYGDNTPCVLELINEIRMSFPKKTIWIYSGFTWEEIYNYKTPFKNIMTAPLGAINEDFHMFNRQEILKQCDVFIDGRYVEELRDITLKWCGSSNQRVIDAQESLRLGEIVLWD